ncbi:MAG: organic solvent tolerance protein OstA [Selenomonadales bacterium]|nr:organic solvent tolerance protein OstA [Selenomonadales bacterium]
MKTKSILILVLLFTLLCSIASAARPSVTADDSYFDPNRGQYILTGNVVITIGDRTITANSARFSPITMEVWGDDGVSLSQGDIHFSGGTVYVNGPERTAYIEGGSSFSRDGLAISSDSAAFCWKSKLATFSGNVTINQNGSTWTSDYQEYDVETNTLL